MNKSELKNSLSGYLGREIAGDFRVLKEHEIALCNDAAKFPFEGIVGCCASFVSLQTAAAAIFGC